MPFNPQQDTSNVPRVRALTSSAAQGACSTTRCETPPEHQLRKSLHAPAGADAPKRQ